MRSFVSVLISIALASFISAAPLHGNHPASVPDISVPSVPSKLPSALQSTSNPAVGGQLGSVEGQVKNVARVRDLKSRIKGAVNSIGSELDARNSTPPSMAAIFSNLTAEIQSCTEKLNFLNPMNLTVTLVEDTFLNMETLINEAITELETLVGEDLAVILAAIDDDGTECTSSQLTNSVANILYMIFSAVQNVLNVFDTKGGKGNVVRRASINPLESEVGALINSVLPTLTKAIDSLVPGLDVTSLLTIFSPLVFPVDSTSTPLSTIDRKV